MTEIDLHTPYTHPDAPLSVDVIVPLRNEARYLPRLLDQLRSQDYPISNFLLVVAPSDDETLALCKEAQEADSRFVVLDNPGFTAPAGMNVGLNHSTANAWIRIDGHTEIPNNLVSTLVQELTSRNVACAGPMLDSGAHTPVQEAIGLAITSPFCVGNARFRTGSGGAGPTDTVAFGLYLKRHTDPLGGFNETLPRTEDDEFNTRLRRSGSTIWLTDRVRVTYYPRTRYRDLFKQRLHSGYWRVIGTFIYGNEVRARQLAPAALVTGTLSSAILSLTSRHKKPIAIMGTAYASVLLGHTLWALRRRAPLALAVRSTIPTAIIHYGYGIGYLAGIASVARKAILRNSDPPATGSSIGRGNRSRP